MKRGASELGASDNPSPSKVAKTPKSLDELLAEVNQGNYDDFRKWLVEDNIQELSLADIRAAAENLSHLGKALQGTNVIKVDLSNNDITDQGAKDFAEALKGTAVEEVGLCQSQITHQGATDFAEGIKGTAVKRVDLEDNYISNNLTMFAQALHGTNVTWVSLRNNDWEDNCAKDFIGGLKGSAVTEVDLSCNKIDDQGAKDIAEAIKDTAVTHANLSENEISLQGLKNLLIALAGSHVTHLDLTNNTMTDPDLVPTNDGIMITAQNLTDNPNTVAMAHELAALIEKTHLLVFKLPFADPTINEALRKNQERILITPYEAARLWYLPNQVKEKIMPSSTCVLTEHASNEKQIQYAGGILANTPIEIAQRIISFLPFMNAKEAENIFTRANNKPPTLIESNEKAPDEDRPLIIAPSRR